MFSKSGRSYLGTVTGRLALWHAGFYALLSLVTFVAVYATLAANLMHRVDTELREDAAEAEGKLVGASRARGEAAFREDIDPVDERKDFRVLLSPTLQIRVQSDFGAWRGVDPVGHARSLGRRRELVRTLRAPELESHARVLLRRLPDGSIIELGTSLADNEELLALVRSVFAFCWLATIVPGLLLGFVVVRRAMAGVDRVSETAVRIGRSDLTQRVPVGREGEEIETLARAVNEMLDRIQLLVRELEDVTNSIAHDLKSPITRIRGQAENTLNASSATPDIERSAALVIEECDRLAAMIDTILELAETDAGVVELAADPVDVARVVRDAVELFQPVAEDRGLRLSVDLPPAALMVRGDRSRIQRVVANLIDNALKYTASGGRVVVAAKAEADGISVTVADSGVGIDSASLSRVFERFYRGDASRSTPGHGLGLSLARAIVRAHGGDIVVRSTPGEGSAFTATWPATPPHYTRQDLTER